ncbi:MAG: sulfite exporter TauE/SafE family protein, partial [Gemmatimonadota bacterium]
VAAAYFMFRDREGERPGPAGTGDGSAAGTSSEPAAGLSSGSVSSPRMPAAVIALEGVAVGVLTGLVGVGGGFLIVPALVVLGRVPMKEAVGTSLLVIALKSAAGFYGYLGQVEVPWAFTTAFSTVAVAGVFVGTYLIRHIPQDALRRTFAVFLVVMGALILWQNRAVVVPGGPSDGAGRVTARVNMD